MSEETPAAGAAQAPEPPDGPGGPADPAEPQPEEEARAGDVRRTVAPSEWVSAVTAVGEEGYRFFDWLTAVDRMYDEDAPGLDVVIRLCDISEAGKLRAVRVTTRVADGDHLDSLTTVFPGTAWHERETFEMFGLVFDGFDDGSGLGLRPLLLPQGFEGTPLRKSFVLAARVSKAWPGGREPGEGHGAAPAGRRRVQAPGVADPEWGPR